MDAVQTIAGAWLMDEIMQTAAPLLHAGGLRTTYARQHRYKLNIADYARPQEIYGRVSFLAMVGDHLQLPPVPKSMSLLAPIEGASEEQTVGAPMFRNLDYLYEMHTMMRFKDEVLVRILLKMRKPEKSSHAEQLLTEMSSRSLTSIHLFRLACVDFVPQSFRESFQAARLLGILRISESLEGRDESCGLFDREPSTNTCSLGFGAFPLVFWLPEHPKTSKYLFYFSNFSKIPKWQIWGASKALLTSWDWVGGNRCRALCSCTPWHIGWELSDQCTPKLSARPPSDESLRKRSTGPSRKLSSYCDRQGSFQWTHLVNTFRAPSGDSAWALTRVTQSRGKKCARESQRRALSTIYTPCMHTRLLSKTLPSNIRPRVDQACLYSQPGSAGPRGVWVPLLFT